MKVLKKIVLVVLVVASFVCASVCMTGCAEKATVSGSYWHDDVYIWTEAYQKNLVGVKNQNLVLYSDGTYVLSLDYQCAAHMSNTPQTGDKYESYYNSRLTIKGTYENVSEDADLMEKTITLVNGELVSVYGNNAMFPMESDGSYNFNITVDNLSVTLDTHNLKITESISFFEIIEE